MSWEMPMRFVTICVSFLSIVTFLAVIAPVAQSNNGDYVSCGKRGRPSAKHSALKDCVCPRVSCRQAV